MGSLLLPSAALRSGSRESHRWLMIRNLYSKMPIKKIHARQIYDSRGNPTVEVDLTTEKGIFRAAVPSGASTGIYEALEMRDKAETWHGKGVQKAVHNVNNLIAPEIVAKCMDPVEQEKIDQLMLTLPQRHQWRQPCWQQACHAGVHGPAHRRHLLLRGHEDGQRAVPPPQKADQQEVRAGRHRRW